MISGKLCWHHLLGICLSYWNADQHRWVRHISCLPAFSESCFQPHCVQVGLSRREYLFYCSICIYICIWGALYGQEGRCVVKLQQCWEDHCEASVNYEKVRGKTVCSPRQGVSLCIRRDPDMICQAMQTELCRLFTKYLTVCDHALPFCQSDYFSNRRLWVTVFNRFPSFACILYGCCSSLRTWWRRPTWVFCCGDYFGFWVDCWERRRRICIERFCMSVESMLP